MKIFSLLLVQCGEKQCRMENHLSVAKGTLVLRRKAPGQHNLDLLAKQKNLIASTDLDGGFIIEKIQENIYNRCTLKRGEGDAVHELGREEVASSFFQRSTLDDMVSGKDVLKALGREGAEKAYELLFCSSLVEGELECTKCGRTYKVSDGIADFVQ